MMCRLRNWSNETSVDESNVHDAWRMGSQVMGGMDFIPGIGSDAPNSDTTNAELSCGMPTGNPCEQHT